MAPDNKDEEVHGVPSEPHAAGGEASRAEAAGEASAKQLQILDEPVGIDAVVKPIAPEEAPDAFVIEDEGGAEDDLEEFDEIEELDDFELVEDDDLEPVAAPPKVMAPPALPPRPPVPRAPPPAAAQAAQAPTFSDSQEPAAAPSSEPAAAPSLLVPDAVSVLDTYLEGRQALDWSKRAAQLTQELEQAQGKARVGELAYELGELCMRRLNDEAAAVKAYGRALQADASLRANLWAIRKIFYRRQLWPNLVKLVGAELRFASDEGQRVDLLIERGGILLHRLDDLPAAQESYEQALALDASSVGALLALERIARSIGDKSLLWRALEGLSKASALPQRKAAFLIELAREYRLSKERHEEAKALLGEATELGVLHEAVAREREALARDMEDASAFAASLERRVATLVESFGAAGVPAPDEVADVNGAESRLRLMVALRRHQAQVLADSGDSEGAWSCLQEALSLSPNDALVLVDLADMAETLGRYEELAELVEARESGELDPARALGLALRRASALARAGKVDEADELISARALTSPGYLPLVTARELHAGSRKDWRRLAALQAELADAIRLGTSFGPGADGSPDPAAAAAHYVVAGDLLRFGADDAQAAISRYQQAREVSPGLEFASEALVSLLVAERNFAKAAVVLQEQAESADPQVCERALEALAAVYLFLDQRSDELAVHRRLQALRPADPLLRDRLLELLREQCLYAELAAELQASAESAADPEEAARYLFEAGRCFSEHLDNPAEAASAFAACHRAWPDDAIVQDCLLDVLRRSQDWQALLAFLQERVDSSSEPVASAELGREALAVCEFQLGDREGASRLAIELAERFPDDLPLLLDALACVEGAANDSTALAALLEAVAARSEGWLRAHVLLRLGSLHGDLGQPQEAEHAYREAGEQGSLAGLLMLHSMSAERGEAEVVTETLVALAGQVESQANRASLLEQAGWRRMAALEDEEAAELFSQANALEGQRAGAALGASLLAAKSGDGALQGECLAALAGVSGSSYARSSLLLRAGLLADVLGDDRVARARIEESRALAPQDAGSAIMAADRLAPLSTDSGASLPELLARAELCGMRAALADPGPGRMDWELERAAALERAGLLQDAGQAVAMVLDQRPDDIRALQALRRICKRGGDRRNLAHSSLSLATHLGDESGRLQFLREAAAIFDEELAEEASAIIAYRMILDLEPGAPEYARMIELLVKHSDLGALYRSYTARLNHLDVQGEQRARVDILLARACLRAGIGDLRGALRDLKALLAIEADHNEALLGRARLLERSGDAVAAAEHYQLFLAVSTAPEQRSSAELSLSHLMVESLDDLQGAIEQLEQVVRQSPQDLELHERLITLLLQGKRTDQAVDMIEDMCSRRASEGERARDQLRIAAVFRNASQPEAAVRRLERAREHDPLNMDVVRDLVELCGGDEKKREALLEGISHDIRKAINATPFQGGLFQRLVTVAQWSEDSDLLRQALEALRFSASLSAEQLQRLHSLPESGTTITRRLSEQEWRSATSSSLSGGDAGGFTEGFASELWALIGPAVSELSGTTPAGLGFERGQRSKGKALQKQYPAVADMVQCIGVDAVEVYVSDASASVARAVSAEVATLCLGTGIVRTTTAAQRFALARALAHAQAGTGTAAALEASRLCLFFAAAANLAGVDNVGGDWTQRVDASALDSMARGLAKLLGRKGRKDLALLAPRFSELENPVRWQRRVQTSAARLGLLLCGSLPAAFEVLDVGKGGRPLSNDPVAQALMAWSVSPTYLGLRKKLGLVKDLVEDDSV